MRGSIAAPETSYLGPLIITSGVATSSMNQAGLDRQNILEAHS